MRKELIKKSDALIVFGTRISIDDNKLFQDILENINENNSQFVYLHPIDDIKLEDKYTQFIKYEVGSEEGVLALLVSYLATNTKEDISRYIKDLDIGYLSAESNVGEEELEELVENLSSKQNKTLIIGKDIISHPRVDNIFTLINILKENTDLNVVLLEDLQKELEEPEEPEEIDSYNGTVIYTICDEKDDLLLGSKSFAMAAKIKSGDMINIKHKDACIKRRFELDDKLKGTVALYPIKDYTQITQEYRFKQVRITKVDE